MIAAIYPGTFDPITNGHMDIIERASAIFDKLVVGIYESSGKRPFFPLERRVKLAEKAIADLPNVQVKPFTGLTVDFVRQMGGEL
jgi:cytidyltransferase-related domain